MKMSDDKCNGIPIFRYDKSGQRYLKLFSHYSITIGKIQDATTN